MSHALSVVDTKYRDFLEQVAGASRRVLMIDYDGTLAPFSNDRARAFPYPTIPRLLDEIMKGCRTRLILITGGPANRIGSLIGVNPSPETWGAYGLERLFPDGRHIGVEVPDETFEALSRAETLFNEEGFQEHVEINPGGVALHWRGLDANRVLRMRTVAYRILNPLATSAGLVVADFDGGVEIRLTCANSGDALRSLLSETENDVPVAYLGDDSPDEDAFRVLNGRGLTALVRTKQRFSAAQLWLRPPDELAAFLNSWIAACG